MRHLLRGGLREPGGQDPHRGIFREDHPAAGGLRPLRHDRREEIPRARRGGAQRRQGPPGQSRWLYGDAGAEYGPPPPPHPGPPFHPGEPQGGGAQPDGRGAGLYGQPGEPGGSGVPAGQAGRHRRGVRGHEPGERGRGHCQAPVVQPLPQGPLHRAAGHRHRLRHGGQHRDAGGQLSVGDADAHVPL